MRILPRIGAELIVTRGNRSVYRNRETNDLLFLNFNEGWDTPWEIFREQLELAGLDVDEFIRKYAEL